MRHLRPLIPFSFRWLDGSRRIITAIETNKGFAPSSISLFHTMIKKQEGDIQT